MDISETEELQKDSYMNPPEAPPQQNLALPGIYARPEEIAMLFLDSSAQITRIQHNLAGEVLVAKQDPSGRIVTVWECAGERKMNDKGIRHVISVLDAYINPNTATSDLNDQEIYNITQKAVKVLNGVLRSKANEFQIDRNYKSTLLNIIGDMIFIELKKARNAGTLKAMTQSYQVRELKGLGQEKKGLSLGDLSPLKMLGR